MEQFTPEELELVHTLWKEIDDDHVWTGWAATGETPNEVWIFRTRAHWRRFPLSKKDSRYFLRDERDRIVATASTLKGLLTKVEAIPGIGEPFLSPSSDNDPA